MVILLDVLIKILVHLVILSDLVFTHTMSVLLNDLRLDLLLSPILQTFHKVLDMALLGSFFTQQFDLSYRDL